MSYEIYIDVRHHPRHNDEDERKLGTALRLADSDGALVRAFDREDDAPILAAVADALRGYADELSPVDSLRAAFEAAEYEAALYGYDAAYSILRAAVVPLVTASSGGLRDTP